MGRVLFGIEVVEEFFEPILGISEVFLGGKVALEAHERGEAPNGKADDAQVGKSLLGRTGRIVLMHLKMAGDHNPDDLDLLGGLGVGKPGKVGWGEGIEVVSVDAVFEGIGVAELGTAFAMG
jgi:hypothetical protein